MKPRTVILGEKPQGEQWASMILDSDLFDIVAGVPRFEGKRWWGEDHFPYILKQSNVPVVKRKELHNIEYDILFSFTYPFIIEGELLEKARMYAVNLHESPLPRYRGCNGYSHAIFECDDTYGTSLHTMTAELDAGDLVDQEIFPINPNETVKELYLRTADVSTKLLERNIQRLASGDVQTTPLDVEIEPVHARSSLEELKRIPVSEKANADLLYRYARAFDFLPFEPAYYEEDGQRYYVFINGSEGRNVHPGANEREVVHIKKGEYEKIYPIF